MCDFFLPLPVVGARRGDGGGGPGLRFFGGVFPGTRARAMAWNATRCSQAYISPTNTPSPRRSRHGMTDLEQERCVAVVATRGRAVLERRS